MRFINKIICADTLKTLKQLPDNLVDLSLTSPPYNKQERNDGGLVKKVVYTSYRDALPERDYQQNQVDVLNEIYRITKPTGSFFYNHKVRYLNGGTLHPLDWLRDTKWLLRQEIIWDRTIAGNIRGWRFWPVEERIYWLYKPKPNQPIGSELDSKHAKLTSIWRIPPERNNSHPAPFPLTIPTRIICSILNEGKGVVLDPYSGSGTTPAVAKFLGHKYIGLEISQAYCDQAVKRINALQPEEIAEIQAELDKHVVNRPHTRKQPTLL